MIHMLLRTAMTCHMRGFARNPAKLVSSGSKISSVGCEGRSKSLAIVRCRRWFGRRWKGSCSWSRDSFEAQRMRFGSAFGSVGRRRRMARNWMRRPWVSSKTCWYVGSSLGLGSVLSS